MSVDQHLVSDVETQLEDDILYFGWLVQIVRQQNPAFTKSECTTTVLDAVTYLREQGSIVVGNACERGGYVCVDPWPESGEELRDRLQCEIAQSNRRDWDFCFWIQLTKHFVG